MSENIAQDPRTNRQIDNDPQTEAYRVPNAAQQPRNYTETPLSEAVGVHFAANPEQSESDGSYFPDRIPSHVVANPDHAAAREVVPSPNNKRSPWVVRSIAAVAAVGVGAGIFAYASAKGKNEAYEQVLGGGITNSAEPFPNSSNGEITPLVIGDTNGDGEVTKDEIQQSSPLEAAKVDTEFLLKAYGQDFDNWREATYDILYKNMTAEQQEVVKMPGSTDKSQFSDQEVTNVVTIDIADASIQEVPEEGQRMLPVVMDPECAGFDGIQEKLPLEGVSVLAYRQIGPELEHIESDSFMGIDLSRVKEARVIKQENIPGKGQDQDRIFQQYGLYVLNDVNGRDSWQLVQKWDDDHSELLEAIRQLR